MTPAQTQWRWELKIPNTRRTEKDEEDEVPYLAGTGSEVLTDFTNDNL